MTPQELKSSILQLAIQGKLVEQRHEEGTGEELYEQIKIVDKQDSANKKAKNKKVALDVSENDFPFNIPDTWKWVRLGAIGYTNIGLTYSPKNVSKAGTIVLRSNNIQNNTMIYEDVVKVEMDIPENKICHIGDILICARNGSKRLVGKAAIIDKEGLSFGAFMAIYRSQCNEYILQVINSAYFRNSLLGDTGTTTINQITQDMLKNALIPLPPLAEQKRIVAKIEELLPYIDRYEQAWSKLEDFNKRFPEDMQKSILQMAIQGKLVEQRSEEGTGEELYQQIQSEKHQLIKGGKIKKEKPLPEITEDDVPFDIPESWKWVRFSNLCTVLTCGYASTPTYVSKECGMPFISAKNVKPYKFMPDDHNYISNELYKKLTQNAKPEKGDILLTRVGAGIGEAAIIDTDLDFAIYVSLTLIKLVNNALIDNRYILYWLNSPIGVSSAKKNIYGKNASQGNLNVKNARDFLIPLPPFAEQKRIVAKLEGLLPLCEKLK